MQHRVGAYSRIPSLRSAIERAFSDVGILNLLKPDTRVALKPNLTYPYHKPGVTTSPEVIRETALLLREHTRHVAIVESDGGYGVWSAEESFRGHHLGELRDEAGISLVNLSAEPSERITYISAQEVHSVPLPVRLMRETDVFISMPVPKVHCMTGLTLAFKNQWGCIPDPMRLRTHHLFNDAILGINRALKPYVLGDGTFFLDRNGPMEGDPVRMDLIIAATDPGSFDLYVSEIMRYPWVGVPHLRRAAVTGDMPRCLSEITFNVPPAQLSRRRFRLARSARNWIALAGFRSRFLTWLGYESWFGQTVLHGILYAIAGRPVKPEGAAHTQTPGRRG